MPDAPPTIVVLGGPNGAGKSTAAPFLIPEALGIAHYINADAIARGISPFAPEAAAIPAARIMLHRMNGLADARESIAFESTLAGKRWGAWLQARATQGYDIYLQFLWLPTPDLAVERVRSRVRSGGHSVDEAVIRRRYTRGLENLFSLYLPLANSWRIFDAGRLVPMLVAEQEPGQEPEVLLADPWSAILRSARRDQ